MFRFLITLTLCLFIGVAGTQAQALRSVSLKGGLVISEQKWDFKTHAPAEQALAEKHQAIGPAAYLTLEWFNIAEHLSLVTDLGYLQKGGRTYYAEATAADPFQYTYFDSNVEYLSAQALAKLRTNIGPVRVYGIAGPRFDRYFGVVKNNTQEPPVKNYERQLPGLTYGGGLEIKVGDMGLLAEYQQLKELAPALRMESTAGASSANHQAYSLQLSVRYYME